MPGLPRWGITPYYLVEFPMSVVSRRAWLLAALGGVALAARHARADTLPAPDADVLLLNRISFGIRPADLSRLQQIGRGAYLEEQLNPASLDDSAVDSFIAQNFSTLSLSADALLVLDQQADSGSLQRVELVRELRIATLYRAWFSTRQLYEVMVDFWSNHFNIHQLNGPLRALKTVDDRAVIRPHALGNFRDLLEASAQSPAMLYYLDNYVSTAAAPNENYARELLELHTLGVDGGYTQTDVQAVARILTGWTIYLGRRYSGTPQHGTFQFSLANHDTGAKTFMGIDFPAGGGLEEGQRLLDILATHPATAQFIATKLVRRFISDTPPPTAVSAVSAAFSASGGDIRSTLRALFNTPEFEASADLKFKRPWEFAIGALRQTDASLTDAVGLASLLRSLDTLGQAPFDWEPPNGYPDTAGYWATTNGLLNRWNQGLQLAENAVAGLRVDLNALLGGANTPARIVDQLASRVLHRTLNNNDRNDLISALGAPSADTVLEASALANRVPGLLGLLLASAYFQNR